MAKKIELWEYLKSKKILLLSRAPLRARLVTSTEQLLALARGDSFMKRVTVAIISRQNKNSKEEFLLVASKHDFGEFAGSYYPPGGHVENNESDEDCLKREIFEELGVEIVVKEKITETSGNVAGQITSW